MSDQTYQLIKIGIIAAAVVGVAFAISWSERARYVLPSVMEAWRRRWSALMTQYDTR